MDNPVSILSQEMSKQFLHSKSESDKYKVQHLNVRYESVTSVFRKTNMSLSFLVLYESDSAGTDEEGLHPYQAH